MNKGGILLLLPQTRVGRLNLWGVDEGFLSHHLPHALRLLGPFPPLLHLIPPYPSPLPSYPSTPPPSPRSFPLASLPHPPNRPSSAYSSTSLSHSFLCCWCSVSCLPLYEVDLSSRCITSSSWLVSWYALIRHTFTCVRCIFLYNATYSNYMKVAKHYQEREFARDKRYSNLRYFIIFELVSIVLKDYIVRYWKNIVLKLCWNFVKIISLEKGHCVSFVIYVWTLFCVFDVE